MLLKSVLIAVGSIYSSKYIRGFWSFNDIFFAVSLWTLKFDQDIEIQSSRNQWKGLQEPAILVELHLMGNKLKQFFFHLFDIYTRRY